MNPKIAEIFGQAGASDSEVDLLAYSTDASRVKGSAKLVVNPSSKEQVQKFVQYAKRSGMHVVPRGAGTGIVGGSVPQDDVVLDMSKMNKLLSLGEDYIVVEAGAVFSDVNRFLSRKDRFVPLDSEINNHRTVGGMIATNAIGLRVMEHGRMEDWVEEVEVVDGTGHCARLTREEAKHFCGSEGTLGIILSAKLRTLPLPQVRSLSILEFNTITSMMESVEQLKQNEHVKMIMYLDDTCSSLVGLGSGIHLFVEYDNEEGQLNSASEVESAVSLINSLDGKLKERKRLVREDPRIPHSELAKFLNWLRKYNIPSYGNIDIGLIHPYFADNSSYELAELYKVVKSVHGSVGWEHGLGLLKKEHASPERKRKAEVLKQNYDPQNFMNRGKLL